MIYLFLQKIDLENKVRNNFNFEDINNIFDCNQIKNELNRVWNNINEQKGRLKDKIEYKIMNIILYNKDSIYSINNLRDKIISDFHEEERRLFNKFEENIKYFLNRIIRNTWAQINNERKRKVEEKIDKIKDIFLTYDYCQTKDDFKREIENTYLNNKDITIKNDDDRS